MNRAFFAMKCHLYEFRKKKVIIPCDSLYPHVPKYPGDYCFSFSIRSNYICLATSACFPKLCSQTKPKNFTSRLFSHAGCVLSWCHWCPCFQLGWVSSSADRQQLALLFQCLVCKCIACCSLETNQFGSGSFLEELHTAVCAGSQLALGWVVQHLSSAAAHLPSDPPPRVLWRSG